MQTQSIVTNDARAQLEEQIKMQFNYLETVLQKAQKNLYEQMEQIIQRLGEYEMENNNLNDEGFPCMTLEATIFEMGFQISRVMQLDIEQFFLPKKQTLFDPNLKFETLIISNNKEKVTQSITCNHYAFCLIANPISKDKATKINLRIDNLQGDVGFGVCDQEIMKQNNYRPKLNAIGSGAYVLFQDCYVINSDNADVNWKTIGLKFESDDYIQVTYFPDTRTVKWFNNKKQKEYKTQIGNIKGDLKFCVVMKHAGSQVSIID